MRIKSLIAISAAATALALTGCRSDGGAEGASMAEPHTAVITQQLEPYECGEITRLHTFQGFFLASQPAPADFEQAKKGGVKTVINLRHSEEITDFNERDVVTKLDLAYHNPAWNGPEELTDAMFDEVRALMRSAERPVLMHCSSGNRVGAMWMAYRALDEDLSADAAAAEAAIVGMKSPMYELIAREYIARHRTGG